MPKFTETGKRRRQDSNLRPQAFTPLQSWPSIPSGSRSGLRLDGESGKISV